MIPLQCLCLFCRPNPFLCILHHQIKQRIFNCSPLCKCAWKHKVNLKVLGTQLLQGMVASQQRGIFSPLLLREPQSLFILGSLQKKCTKEALRSIQDAILLFGRDKSWRVDLSLPGAGMDANVSQYPSTRNDVFKDPIEFFRPWNFFQDVLISIGIE